MNHLKYPCYLNTKNEVGEDLLFVLQSEEELLDLSVQILTRRVESGMFTHHRNGNPYSNYASYEEFVQDKTGLTVLEAQQLYLSLGDKRPDNMYAFVVFMDHSKTDWVKEENKQKWLATFSDTLKGIQEGRLPKRAAYSILATNSSNLVSDDMYFKADNFDSKDYAK